MATVRFCARFHIDMVVLITLINLPANCVIRHPGEMCNHRGGSIYLLLALSFYIGVVSYTPDRSKKGKTMAPKTLTTVIWDFPVHIYKTVRQRIAKFVADRAQADERWLNG
jgi:hypothetical protein